MSANIELIDDLIEKVKYLKGVNTDISNELIKQTMTLKRANTEIVGLQLSLRVSRSGLKSLQGEHNELLSRLEDESR